MGRSTVGFIVTLALGLLGASLAAEAQQARPVPRIGYLGDAPGPFADAFRHSLRERGYIEGKNIAIEYRWTEGRDEQLPDLVAELVQRKVDVLVTPGSQTSRAAKQATSMIPIVIAHVGNPVGSGLIASLARPGGNITGVSVMGSELNAKQLELLKQAVPRASHVAVLSNPTHPRHSAGLKELQEAAQVLGVTLHVVDVRHPADFESTFAAIRTVPVDALFVRQDHLFFSHRTRIVDFAAQSRLPAMYMYREWVDAGGLMAYGASLREVYSRVAELVDKILKGAKPADLPVEQVMRLQLVINLKTAKALGITMPPSLLLLADEVIQ